MCSGVMALSPAVSPRSDGGTEGSPIFFHTQKPWKCHAAKPEENPARWKEDSEHDVNPWAAFIFSLELFPPQVDGKLNGRMVPTGGKDR